MRCSRLLLPCLSILVFVAGAVAGADQRLNVEFAPGVTALERVQCAVRHGARIARDHPSHQTLTVEGSAATKRALTQAAGVLRVEPDYVHTAIVQPPAAQGKPGNGGTPPPAEFAPTGVDRIDAEPGVGIGSGAGVVVAIVDTGLDLTHPDLQPNIVGSYNAISPGSSANDDNGHGSHCGGTVAGAANEVGVIGVAPQAHLLGVKVLNRRGSGFSSDIADGIDWATDNGAQVINLSLGSSSPSSLIHAAVQRAASAGVTLVCAAGNEDWAAPGGSTVGWPAAFPECIAVSAWTDLDGTPAATGAVSPWGDLDESLASFSSTGPEVEVTAPGVNIFSTWMNGGYNTISGTSMASPHAAGVVARLIQAGAADPRGQLSATAVAVADTDPTHVGAGLIWAGLPTLANDAPSLTITAPGDGATFATGASIALQATANDTEDGDLSAAIAWSSDLAGDLGSGADFSVILADGFHTITARVTDAGGKTATATVAITVGNPPPPPPSPTVASVTSIGYGLSGGPHQNRNLSITVQVVDDLGTPVAGATVAISLALDGTDYASGSGATATDGTVTFSLRNAPSGTYSTTVTAVSAAGLTWDGATPANTFTK